MHKISMDLAPMAPFYILATVVFHGGPVVPLPHYLLGKHMLVHVRSIYSGIDLFHHLFCLYLSRHDKIFPMCDLLFNSPLYMMPACIM